MTSETLASPWIKAPPIFGFHYDYAGIPLQSKNNAIIIPVGPHRTRLSALLKYDVIKNECAEFMKLPEALSCGCNYLCIDKETNIIYGVSKNGIYAIDLNTKETKIIFKSIETESLQQYGWKHNATLTIAESKLHIFAENNDYEDIHSVYDINTGVMRNEEVTLPAGDFAIHRTISVESRNILIFVGVDYRHTVVMYDISKDIWKMMDIRVSVDNDDYEPGIIATRDGRYIIFFIQTDTGWDDEDDDEDENAIEIIDLEKKTIRISDVKFPKPFVGSTHAFLVDDFAQSDIIINGYLRRFGRLDIPFDLIGMMIKYFAGEYVHLYKRTTGAHWTIPLDEIVKNVH